jgi:hypothetical protein
MECSNLRNHKFVNYTDFLQLQESNYNEISSVGNVCTETFIQIVS